MDDYSLILSCKKGNQKAQVELFGKYKNFLKKKFFQLSKAVPQSSLQFGDFQNEAFIWFLKAVEYVDIKKIYNPIKWRFITPFMYYISNMIDGIKREEKSHKNEVSFSNLTHTPYGEEEDTEWIDFFCHDIKDDPTGRKALENIGSEQFVESLNDIEKKVFLSAQQLENGRVPSLDVLASRFNMSRSWMAKILQNVRKRFSNYEVEYIH